MQKPAIRPAQPQFSSGPCRKYPGFDCSRFDTTALGRSHRSALAREKLKDIITNTREILGIPDDYLIAIVPASDTGAVELAMWNLLGARPVTMAAWDAFGFHWIVDARELGLDAEIKTAPWGEIVDMTALDYDRDIVFTWNGTSSGVRVPDGVRFPHDREGLTICDASSAVFGMALPWDSLDATAFSWQKVLGGEAAHGMLVLSPRAIKRLNDYSPRWPLPKIFRLKKDGRLLSGLFEGETLNTPSLLAAEDMLQALAWARSVGGLRGLIARSEANARLIWDFCDKHGWVRNLACVESVRSTTSVCLVFDDSSLAPAIVRRLEDEGVAFDIGSYRDAPVGLRIWCGATVSSEDIAALLVWLEWAYASLSPD